MRNIAVINGVGCSDRSTGLMAVGLTNYFIKKGFNAFLCYGHGEAKKTRYSYKIDTEPEHYLHALLCRLTGIQGAYSTLATKRLIKFLQQKEIDTIYAISLHGYYLNEKLFFKYINDNDINFIYIMTEEYPYFGKCGYNDGCTNYLKECKDCPQYRQYPASWFFDRANYMYRVKKEAYKKLKHTIFVGPEYTVRASKVSPLMDGIKTAIVDECINVNVFYPRDTSRLKKELKISENKKVIVCVAPMSYPRKGCKYFVDLAKALCEKKEYIFVHVGYDIDDKSMLPSNYIPVGYIKDQERLAEFFSLGDLFVFPSLLDTMPLACLESLACGTPLLIFNVSGMPYIADNSVSDIVEVGNIDKMCEVVKKTNKKDCQIIKTCRKYALSRYDSRKYGEKLLKIGIELSTSNR